MADEVIPGVSIGITADFTDLDAQFEAAVARAVAEGATLAAAIQAAVKAPDASGAAEAFDQVGAAAQQAASQLDLFDEAAHVDFADATGQLNMFATELEPIAGAAISAEAALAQMGAELAGTGEAANSAGGMLAIYGEAARGILDAQRDADAELATAQEALTQIEAAYSLGEASANELARATQAVQSAFAEANPALEQAATDAHEAESGFAAMAEQLVAFGEALVVTEKLKEFGEEALRAYDSLQRADNSLTALTGSAEQAKEVIESIEKIAATQPFSFPELAQAAQKMAAFGIEAAKIPDLLAAAGNASRATGNSFDAIASALERVSLSGQVTARQLVQLGVSWGDLATAAGKSIEETQALLKKGGQDAADDLDLLLKTVQDKFGDFAKVPLSIGEQWTVLENQMHTVFASIGEAIAPAVQNLVGLLQNELIPAIKDGIEWFKGLPQPLQDTAVAVGLVVAAIAPLAVGLGAIGLAITGAQAAIPAFTGLIEMLGLSSATTAVEEEAAALATTHLGEAAAAAGGAEGLGGLGAAANVAEGALSGMAGIIGLGLVVALTAAAAGFSDLKASMADLHAQADATDKVFQDWIKTLADSANTTQSIADAQDKVKQALDAGAISAQKAAELNTTLATSLDKVKESANKLAGADIAQGMKDLGISVEVVGQAVNSFSDETQKLLTHQADLKSKLADTKLVLDELTQSLATGTTNASGYRATVQDVAAAQAAFDAATKALDGSLSTVGDALKGAKDAAKEFAAELNTANGMLQKADDILAKLPVDTKAYLDSLADGGKNAKQIWDEVSALIQKASDKTLSLKGEPLVAVQSMVEALKALKQPLMDFADAGEFSKISTALGDLDAKVGGLKTDTLNMFNNLLGQLAEIPGAVATNGAALIKWIQQVAAEDEKLDKQQEQLNLKFEKAGDAMAKAAQQQIPIIVDLRERLAGIDTTFQGLKASSEHLWDVSAIGGYLNMVKDMNAEGLKTVQQQEALIASQTKLLNAMEAANQPYTERLALESKIIAEQIALDEMQGKSVEGEILGLEKVKLALEANRLATHGLADEYVHMIDDVLKGFDQMGAVMATAIVEGKNLGAALIGEFKKIGESIVADLINAALLPLKQEFLTLIGTLLPGVNAGLAASTQGISSLSTAATAGAVAQGVHTAATGANTAATTISAASLTQLGIAAQLASISMFTMMGAIGSIVGAIAGIVGDVYLAAIDTKLFHLNTAALGIFNETQNARADAWVQYNGMYDRLGECKNDLDGILDTLKTASAGPGGLSDQAMSDLDSIPDIIGAVRDVTASVVYLAGIDRALLPELQDINSAVYQVHDDLAIVITELNTVVTSILYGGQSTSAMAGDIRQMSANATSHTNAILGGLGKVGSDVTTAQAHSTQTLGQDLGILTTSTNSSTQSILSQMVQSDANNGGYVSSSTEQIVGAVYGGASMVAAAVGVAVANAGGYNNAPGGGTTTYIPKKTVPTYQQGTESQNPGNSNSPTGNTGSTDTTGAQGGYSIPKSAPAPPPIGTTQWAPGSTTQNPGGGPNNPASNSAYNPLDPFTWTDTQSPNNPNSQTQQTSQAPAQYIPGQYDLSKVPSYDMGGLVPVDMLSLVHKDEMVLPPDISLMLRRMASTPAGPSGYPTYAGSPGVSSGGGETKIYAPVTFNGVTNSRQLMDMWTNEVKKIIPRATVFSS